MGLLSWPASEDHIRNYSFWWRRPWRRWQIRDPITFAVITQHKVSLKHDGPEGDSESLREIGGRDETCDWWGTDYVWQTGQDRWGTRFTVAVRHFLPVSSAPLFLFSVPPVCPVCLSDTDETDRWAISLFHLSRHVLGRPLWAEYWTIVSVERPSHRGITTTRVT